MITYDMMDYYHKLINIGLDYPVRWNEKPKDNTINDSVCMTFFT